MDIIKELRAGGLLARIHIHVRKRVSLGEWKKRVPLLKTEFPRLRLRLDTLSHTAFQY